MSGDGKRGVGHRPQATAPILDSTSSSYSPTNQNWGHWSAPHLDDLLQQAQETFDPTARDKILAEAHALVVDEAPWVWIVHDLNPRAMSARVKGFRPAQSWSQDFTSITME